MTRTSFTIVGLGEILWDMLPGGKQLGGAPTNFAFQVQALGNRGVIASRVGDDPLGVEIRGHLQALGLSDEYLQTDGSAATGTVDVTVDDGGQPTYVIHEPVAWDFFAFEEQWRSLAEQADAVCFGSLAQRNAVSRACMGEFLDACGPKTVLVYDVNLRQSFYSREVLEGSLRRAQVVKLNDEELPVVCELLGVAGDDEAERMGELVREYDLAVCCVTRGARGCVLRGRDGVVERAGQTVKVADTVGSGDAFTAGLVHHYLRGATLERMAEAANRLGAWVATQAGGTTAPSGDVLAELR